MKDSLQGIIVSGREPVGQAQDVPDSPLDHPWERCPRRPVNAAYPTELDDTPVQMTSSQTRNP